MNSLFRLPKNVFLLSLAQIIGMSAISVVSFTGGLIGVDIAPSHYLVTLPATMMLVGLSLATIPGLASFCITIIFATLFSTLFPYWLALVCLGIGLGLFICNEIIKMHYGKMWIKSEEGKGSTFYFSVPIYKK